MIYKAWFSVRSKMVQGMKNRIIYRFAASMTVAILLWLIVAPGRVNAQQEAQYSMYMFNGLVINPAYAGSRDGLSARAIVRKQWFGIEGSPTSAAISIHAPSRNNRHGFGGALTEDNLGITNMVGAYGYYAYRIPVGNGTLSLGLQAGVMNYMNLWNRIELISGTDQGVPKENQMRWLPIAGAGLYFSSRRFFAGVGMPNVIPNRYTSIGVDLSQDEARQVLHLFATTGVVIPIGRQVDLKPSVLMKYALNAPVEFDFNINVFIKERIWFGVGYRMTDALVFMAEYVFQNGFRIGYAYDLSVARITRINSGSHELMLGLDLGLGREQISTPRYF